MSSKDDFLKRAPIESLAYEIYEGQNHGFSVSEERAELRRRGYTVDPMTAEAIPLSTAAKRTSSSRGSPRAPRSAGYCSKCRGPHVYKHGRP